MSLVAARCCEYGGRQDQTFFLVNLWSLQSRGETPPTPPDVCRRRHHCVSCRSLLRSLLTLGPHLSFPVGRVAEGPREHDKPYKQHIQEVVSEQSLRQRGFPALSTMLLLFPIHVNMLLIASRCWSVSVSCGSLGLSNLVFSVWPTFLKF